MGSSFIHCRRYKALITILRMKHCLTTRCPLCEIAVRRCQLRLFWGCCFPCREISSIWQLWDYILHLWLACSAIFLCCRTQNVSWGYCTDVFKYFSYTVFTLNQLLQQGILKFRTTPFVSFQCKVSVYMPWRSGCECLFMLQVFPRSLYPMKAKLRQAWAN